jgi:hypothetical protein
MLDDINGDLFDVTAGERQIYSEFRRSAANILPAL